MVGPHVAHWHWPSGYMQSKSAGVPAAQRGPALAEAYVRGQPESSAGATTSSFAIPASLGVPPSLGGGEDWSAPVVDASENVKGGGPDAALEHPNEAA